MKKRFSFLHLWLSGVVAFGAGMCVQGGSSKQLQEEGGPEPVLNEAAAERMIREGRRLYATPAEQNDSK